MNYTEDRPYSDPDKAARKLIEIANEVEPVQARILHRSLRRDCPTLPENRRRWNCHLYHSVRSQFVSGESLLKTGVSAVLAGDF